MLAALIIFMLKQIEFVFQPMFTVLQILFAPIAVAGVLYYLFRPLVGLLANWIPRGVAILLLYLSAVGGLTMFILTVGPEVQNQFNSLINTVPRIVYQAQVTFINLQENELIGQFIEQTDQYTWEELTREAAIVVNDFVRNIGTNITGYVGTIANFLIVLIIIPFVLYYMLKEGGKAPDQVFRFLSTRNEHEARRIFNDMDHALSSYIQGQVIVSFCVGVLVYIGYLIIDLDYPLVLALVAMFTNVIPFVGPWIGTFPGVVVGLFDSWLMGLLVVIVVVIVQQIESNIISPQVMGRKLQIHPVTILLLLLVAGRFGGILWLILAVPTYAVVKVIASNTYRLIKLRQANTD
ncbi:putative PurR-regulated permease PerM [Salsuginibacillus halophilus]|uniref:Putative PurR-regulated permease PerM n=1 Tax=Salsuginibacillus halophilus TaxID=517424 RepID=A0A2P8HXT2_9BACI|nr:putative PurR-regulated permease PerM [Salsuginibacillus halophilus]